MYFLYLSGKKACQVRKLYLDNKNLKGLFLHSNFSMAHLGINAELFYIRGKPLMQKVLLLCPLEKKSYIFETVE